MPRKKGQTAARAQAIVDDCIRKIARENTSHGDWCRYAVEEYKITTRRAEQIWSKAWEGIRDRFAQDAETNLLQAVARLDDLYTTATKEHGDWNTRNNILREKHKLLGLYVDKQEVRTEGRLSFDFDNAEEDMGDEN